MWVIILLVLAHGHPVALIHSGRAFMTLRDCNIALLTGTLPDMRSRPGIDFRVACAQRSVHP